jgi:ABC-2 type transport system permease protein
MPTPKTAQRSARTSGRIAAPMSGRILASTTRRIMTQLRHDRRTIALLLVVPSLLLTLLYFMFDADTQAFGRVGLVMLGLFPHIMMFLVTSIVMLRERQSGTLERLFTTPVSKLDLLFGYGIAFSILAALQATIAASVAYYLLDLDPAGSVGLVVLIAVANAVLGVALGLLCSAFARSEFQAVQFMPVVILPQALLCGLFVPREAMVGWLQAISDALPMTYAVSALQEVGAHADPTSAMWRDLGIVAGAAVIALVLAAATLRRRTG